MWGEGRDGNMEEKKGYWGEGSGLRPRGGAGAVVIGMLLETTVNKRDFPGGPLAKNAHSQCRGPRFHLRPGTTK